MPKYIKKHSARLVKILLQLIFFILSPGLFASAFGGAKALAASMGKGNALEMSANVTVLILLLVFTFLFGRVFCGAACAFGALGDAVRFVAEMILKKAGVKKTEIRMPTWARFIKYGVLVIMLMLSAMGFQQYVYGKSPWDAFARILSGRMSFDRYVIGMVLLALIAVGMAATPRFFCKVLCPLGAIFSLLPPALFMRIKKPTAESATHKACGNCTLCSSKCPADLKLTTEDEIKSGECFSCCACTESCWQAKPVLGLPGLSLPSYVSLALTGVLLMLIVMGLGL